MRIINDIEGLFKLTDYPDSKCCLKDLIGGRNIMLYGAGSGFTTFAVYILRKYGLKPYAVIDRKFKTKTKYCNIPAYPASGYVPTEKEKQDTVVVITVGKEYYHQEIISYLKGLGFQNIILATDIYEYHLLSTPNELIKNGFCYYHDNQSRIEASYKLFTDNLSREIFSTVLRTHMLRQVTRISSHPLKEQYFPHDIKMVKGYSRFVSCGAYDGDTIKQLNKYIGKVDTVVCFEPDIDNYELLARYLCERHNDIANTVFAYPCGVFSREAQPRFSNGDKTNSMVSEQGNSFIQCATLDKTLPGFNPTFITMDVEGMELEALKGAEVIIRENKPDLAICIYHSPNHLWDIPLYLYILSLGYKFYLRNYTSFISETVLYATIGEKNR